MTADEIIPHALLPCNRISATIHIHIHVHDGAQWILQGHGIGHGEQSADGRFRFIVDAAGDADEQVAEGGGSCAWLRSLLPPSLSATFTALLIAGFPLVTQAVHRMVLLVAFLPNSGFADIKASSFMSMPVIPFPLAGKPTVRMSVWF